jgi:hypothetical protein
MQYSGKKCENKNCNNLQREGHPFCDIRCAVKAGRKWCNVDNCPNPATLRLQFGDQYFCSKKHMPRKCINPKCSNKAVGQYEYCDIDCATRNNAKWCGIDHCPNRAVYGFIIGELRVCSEHHKHAASKFGSTIPPIFLNK